MPTKTMKALVVISFAGFAFQIAGAQATKSKGSATADNADTPNVAKVLKGAADALGMPRVAGAGGNRLPQVDAINRMEFWGTGTSYAAAPGAAPGAPRTAYKTDFHIALGYDPPAMRVELTRTGSDGSAPQHIIQTMRDNFAWNESEIGAGLESGKGTATPALPTLKRRLLELWVLPYGVVKAGLAAGDQTKVSMENGLTIVSFPLSGELAGVNVRATLDAKNFVTKVETQTENTALADLVTETEYSDYADHGEILTDVKSPAHIVQKQRGSPVLDIQVKSWDANNPYLVFPVPQNVKRAAGH